MGSGRITDKQPRSRLFFSGSLADSGHRFKQVGLTFHSFSTGYSHIRQSRAYHVAVGGGDEFRLSFFTGENSISFCHGDLHPLNVIWGEKSIRAVIDWEFSGIKPEIYDLANMLGCLGMEDPANLFRPLCESASSWLERHGRLFPGKLEDPAGSDIGHPFCLAQRMAAKERSTDDPA